MKLVAPTASRPVPWLLATFLGFYGLFAGGHLYTGDAQTVLATDRSLLAGRGFAIPFDRAYGGSFSADRKFYGQYGLGAVLTGLAPAAAGDALATALPGGAEPTGLLSRLPFSFWNVPFSAGSIVLLFLVVGRLGFRASTGFALAAACGTATMFWPYAARDFTEPQVTFFFLLTYHELLRLEQTRRLECAAFAGAAAGWALLVKVYVVVMAPLFFIESWRRGGRRAAA
ncbi:MAG: glycosyltransferase family 39 protein, partial [Candidatus Wallbacteria bacterium]|nr:glycosyltransferase family 39 protein [Candidatus Wallbacteria bacterium]